jgi:GTP-sensing pleiotropic transcriptional regulator CodY
MKLSKLLVFAVLFTVSALSAKGIDPSLKSILSKEISTLIKDVKFEKVANETIYVNFIVNAHGEILVTSTSDEKFDGLLKSTLNYKKISVNGVKPYEVYTLPITIK